MTTAPPPPKSDLGVRTASAVVMIAVAGSALWLGGYWWTAFVAAVALGVLWEWWGLACAITMSAAARSAWLIGGVIYVGLAGFELVVLHNSTFGFGPLLTLLGAVIATDIGAYFAGRTIGGAKIAPKISPSKTWAGLGGGVIAASLIVWLARFVAEQQPIAAYSFVDQNVYLIRANGLTQFISIAVGGSLIAIIAQAGDFFESWMKRRAKVKDSGAIIPGHGGVFDRVDGLLPVAIVIGSYMTNVAS